MLKFEILRVRQGPIVLVRATTVALGGRRTALKAAHNRISNSTNEYYDVLQRLSQAQGTSRSLVLVSSGVPATETSWSGRHPLHQKLERGNLLCLAYEALVLTACRHAPAQRKQLCTVMENAIYSR